MATEIERECVLAVFKVETTELASFDFDFLGLKFQSKICIIPHNSLTKKSTKKSISALPLCHVSSSNPST